MAEQVIHGLQGLGGVIPVPADEFTDVGPVFLLDMSVVVFKALFSPAGYGNLNDKTYPPSVTF